MVDRLDRFRQSFRNHRRRRRQDGRSIGKTEQNRIGELSLDALALGLVEPGIEGAVLELEIQSAVPHRQDAGAGVGQRNRHAIVGTVFGLAVDMVAGKTDELAGLAQWCVEQAEAHWGNSEVRRSGDFVRDL